MMEMKTVKVRKRSASIVVTIPFKIARNANIKNGDNLSCGMYINGDIYFRKYL